MATNAALKYDQKSKYGWQATQLPLARTPLVKPNFKIPVLPQLDKTANELLLSMPKEVRLELQAEMRVVNRARRLDRRGGAGRRENREQYDRRRNRRQRRASAHQSFARFVSLEFQSAITDFGLLP